MENSLIPHSPTAAPLALLVSNSPTILLQLSKCSHILLAQHRDYVHYVRAKRWEFCRPFVPYLRDNQRDIARPISLLLGQYRCWRAGYIFVTVTGSRWIAFTVMVHWQICSGQWSWFKIRMKSISLQDWHYCFHCQKAVASIAAIGGECTNKWPKKKEKNRQTIRSNEAK